MTQLKSGDEAPLFIAETVGGGRLSLESFRGKKVWLSFHRYAKCPICNFYINKIFTQVDAFRSEKVEVIAVFESSPDKFPKHLAGKPVSGINIIADPNKILYRAYGMQSRVLSMMHPSAIAALGRAMVEGYPQGIPDGDLGQLPGHFFINEKGRITFAYYGRHPADNIPVVSPIRMLQYWDNSALISAGLKR